jgi:hypothetical protein
MTLTRTERDSFTARTPEDLDYGEGACLETPPDVFRRLHQRFRFDVDLTANEQNHLLPKWFGPGSVHPDALEFPWTVARTDDGWKPNHLRCGFSNPPYGPFISRILAKALIERDNGFTSVFLLPMRAAGWFRDLVIPYYSELWYCKSRLTFYYQGVPRPNVKTGKADPALFDSIIVVYAPYDRTKWGLFPPSTRPNVWDPRTGELSYAGSL